MMAKATPGEDNTILTSSVVENCRSMSALSLISCSLLTEENITFPKVPSAGLKKKDDLLDVYSRNRLPQRVVQPDNWDYSSRKHG